MMQIVFIPAIRWRFRAYVARQQRWTSFHDAVLLKLFRAPASMDELGAELSIEPQVLTATVSRLLRAGLIELVFENDEGRFRATSFGIDLIASGAEPRVEEETRPRPISSVFLPLTSSIVRTSEVRFIPLNDRSHELGLTINLSRQFNSRDQMELLYDRLTDSVRLRPNEVVRAVDPKSIDMREGYVEVRQETLTCLPETEAKRLAAFVKARRRGKGTEVAPLVKVTELEIGEREIPWNPDSVVVGGSSHKTLFEDVLGRATDRVVILSTFIDEDNVKEIWQTIENAAERGVKIDLLYGVDGEDAEKHGDRAQSLAARIVGSRHSARIQMHRQSVSTHAKFLLADDGAGGYLAVSGSCNWLSTPFRAAEVSVILRYPPLVSQIASICRLAFSNCTITSDLAAFLGSLSRWGDELVYPSSPMGEKVVTIKLLAANEHAGMIRRAAVSAKDCLVVGSHRFGSTAEQAMLVAAANAAQNVSDMRVIYTQIRKPQFRSDVSALRAEYEPKGVRFVHLDTQKGKVPVHGKFLVWDSDNAVITSLNWASATVRDDDLTSEVGVHLCGVGVGRDILEKIQSVVPQVRGDVG